MDARITRRDFLARGLAAGAGVLAPLATLGRSFAEDLSGPPEVVAAIGEPTQATHAAVKALGGMGAFVKPGQRVVIKPNMSFANPPDKATTTHPDVVRAVAQLCLEAGAQRVLVLDHTLRDPNLCKLRSGIPAAVKDLPKVTLVTINQPSYYTDVPVPEGVQVASVQVAKPVLRSDVLIAVPVAKSHSASGISMGLKGMMGLIWDRGKFHSEYDLHQAIADLSTVLRADLTIIDASRALLTRGPGGPGRVAELNTIVASRDPVAADAYTVGLTPWYNRTFKGSQVGHIARASKLGVGEADVSKMSIRTIQA